MNNRNTVKPSLRRSEPARAGLAAILILASLAAVLGPALPAAAQEKSPPAGTFRGETQVEDVLVDALVSDSAGRVVLGLGKDDFVVEEDGKPVELNGVAFYSNRHLVAGAERAEKMGVTPGETPTDRWFVLFFDDPRTALPRLLSQQLDAGRRAEEWARTDMLPNDYVAVVGYNFRLRVFQDFTNDREAVARGIERAMTGDEVPAYGPSAAGKGPSLLAGLPATIDAVRDGSTRIYGALELVAKAVAPLEGRKNLVLFSIGFGDVDRSGFYVPDPRYYPGLVHTLNTANVAVYAVDLIPTSAGGPPLGRFLGSSLSGLASETGGRYYYTFVNFLTPLEQISTDTNGYYLLSYTSRHPAGESGYQEVEVKTTNPEFKVRAREGYLFGEKGSPGRDAK